MGNFFRNARITGAANDVMGGLHFARSEAIKRRVPVTLCTSADPLNNNPVCDASALLTGWVAFVDPNQNGATRRRAKSCCCSTNRCPTPSRRAPPPTRSASPTC